MYARSAVISGNQWGEIMTEDKSTLKEWFIDMKTLIDQDEEIDEQIKSYQRAIKSLEQAQLENSSKREKYAQRVLGENWYE